MEQTISLLAWRMPVMIAAAIPWLNSFNQRAETAAVSQNLRALRSQIALYRLEHDGNVPLLYRGGLPQLTQATNVTGVPGPRGSKFPLGPYFPSGVPPNPCTSICVVTLTETFPPTAPSGNGGWLYHQETGQVAADSHLSSTPRNPKLPL